jgi:hypothetical protein
MAGGEIIVVRSLAVSDLGLFGPQRKGLAAKQRAIALTTPVARRMLSPRLFGLERGSLDVICVYGNYAGRERRHVGRAGKNWRLGGNQISDSPFAFLDGKDFVVLRTPEQNDGDDPVLMTFIGRQRERIMHAGMVAILDGRLKDSVAVLAEGTDAYEAVAATLPCIPARVAFARLDGDAGSEPLLRTAGGNG